MGWLKDLLDPLPELTRSMREMEDNAKKAKNGICPCRRLLCNCTYPKCGRL